MTKVERKQLNILREKYFEYRLEQMLHGNTEFSKRFFSDYYTCLEFYCETYEYDLTKKSESLEKKWNVMFRKEYK